MTQLTMLAWSLVGCAVPSDIATGTSSPSNLSRTETRLHWIVDKLNSTEQLRGEDLAPELDTASFSPEDAERLLTYLNSVIRPQGPFVVVRFQRLPGGDDGLVALLRSRWGILTDLTFTSSTDGKVASWFFAASESIPPPATSFEEIKRRLKEISPETSLLVQRSRSGRQLTDVGLHSAEVKPMSSIFKLYVLGAVAAQVGDGTLSWKDQVVVSDDKKSPGTGTLRDTPAGTHISVHDAAKAMIGTSDNTAANILMDLVGEKALTRAVEDLGHHDPKLLSPFLSPHDMFGLTAGRNTDVAASWATSDQETKRAIIASLGEEHVEPSAMASDRAFWTQGLDWFASVEDISQAFRKLRLMVSKDPKLGEVLESTINGPAIDQLAFLSSKSGSAPGVQSTALMAELKDGTVVTAVAQVVLRDGVEMLDLRRDEISSLVADALRIASRRTSGG
ncbi:serine hydrolase [Leifsonia shinshuensis]|uniref:Serine hydrolase n=1 Tax=Leifsonia shinshuensis TaxID=150026 RepID=A0A7G6YFW6_9MICO|nr:serine hydrolase [Leifsonia shinshuensis]QNE37381.1 serine hydrolase [Leifsonia shinshuensis]